ncbi:MAG: hypothetical protein NT007_07540 [Candidatus Kapabacteria bacterium]|nr:hypothetical protein [Candidatus Kapabacteria bacterium]
MKTSISCHSCIRRNDSNETFETSSLYSFLIIIFMVGWWFLKDIALCID